MTTALVALILVPLSMALVAGIVLLLARPLVLPVIAAWERQRLRLAQHHVAAYDTHLAAGRLDHALRALEQSFCLIDVRSGSGMLDALASHHVGVLARILAFSDRSPRASVRLLALAKVERLLERRRDMQRALLQLRRRAPSDARVAQLGRSLRRNGHETRRAIRELTADLHLLTERRQVLQ